MKKNKELEPELENQYGKIILTSFARYWGGHDRYVAGGTFTNFISLKSINSTWTDY